MTESVHCPKCGNNFSSNESYQDHLPCGSSTTVGGEEDIGKAKFAQETEGTGEGN